jgi:hypothetical protein
MTEPLAEGRDEVIYLICTHPRVALGQRVNEDGSRNVYRADGAIGGPWAYDMEEPWARVRFPEHVRPSVLGWAVLDPLLETVEGLLPDSSFDPSRDPEGEDGRHRHELLPWIFDRHLEMTRELQVDRGEVQGGEIDFRLEYIGKAGREALRRASGPHHKVPLILGRTLLYDSHRLVYSLPCEIRVAIQEGHWAGARVELLPLGEAPQADLHRDLWIAAAEEALIATVGAPENRRNTEARRFPQSDAGERLVAMGVEQMVLAFTGIPERMTIRGERESIDCKSHSYCYGLEGASLQLPDPDA